MEKSASCREWEHSCRKPISIDSKFLCNVLRLTITVSFIIGLIIFQAVLIDLDLSKIDLVTLKPIGVFGCTVVLISHRFAITAGHCLNNTGEKPHLIRFTVIT